MTTLQDPLLVKFNFRPSCLVTFSEFERPPSGPPLSLSGPVRSLFHPLIMQGLLRELQNTPVALSSKGFHAKKRGLTEFHQGGRNSTDASELSGQESCHHCQGCEGCGAWNWHRGCQVQERYHQLCYSAPTKLVTGPGKTEWAPGQPHFPL